jgi:ligand-binding sensor domain-containing protein
MKNCCLQKKTYLLLLILICTISCNGQDKIQLPKKIHAGQPQLIAVKSKTTSYGPNNEVYCGLQDKAGNIWFGTSNGVFVYDGKAFTIFTDAEKFGMMDNRTTAFLYRVYSILEDKNGNIWFGTSDGVCFYDGKEFTSFPIPAADVEFKDYPSAQLSSKSVISIFQDKTGNIWFGTQGFGAYRYDGKYLTNFIETNGLSSNCVQSILEDHNGKLWFATRGGGVSAYDGESFINVTAEEVPYNHLFCMMEEKSGKLWLGTVNSGARCYNGETFVNFTTNNGLCDNHVTGILEDKAGKLWFGTGKGLCSYDGKDFTSFTTKDGLCDNAVKFLLEDQTGKLWIGTRSGMSNYDGKSFTNFFEQKLKH